MDKDGKPLVSFRGLRYSAGSIMLAAGVPLIVVSRQLGHANPKITAEVHAHLLADTQLDAAAEVFEAPKDGTHGGGSGGGTRGGSRVWLCGTINCESRIRPTKPKVRGSCPLLRVPESPASRGFLFAPDQSEKVPETPEVRGMSVDLALELGEPRGQVVHAVRGVRVPPETGPRNPERSRYGS
jgi:hypothetical protein